jgi:hypothetical protein
MTMASALTLIGLKPCPLSSVGLPPNWVHNAETIYSSRGGAVLTVFCFPRASAGKGERAIRPRAAPPLLQIHMLHADATYSFFDLNSLYG